MVLLVDEAQVEAHFGLFGDCANLDAREVLGLHQMYHTLRKSFWTHTIVLQGEEAQVEARFGLFGDSANLDAREVHGLR
jgi:hypothetical protein